MTSVRPETAEDRRWRALADELAPAKSLQRLDAAAARVVSTVSVVATVLTGLGLLAAGASNLPGPARVLAVAAAVVAVVALMVALAGQAVSVGRGLKLDNLAEVEQWYLRRFQRRAPLARIATILLVVAVACAGLAAVVSLLGGEDEAPTLAVTQTADAVTVDLTFRGLDPGQIATATVKVDSQVVAVAAFGPGTDGTATRSFTVAKVAVGGVVSVYAQGGASTCTATLQPGAAPTVTCPTS